MKFVVTKAPYNNEVDVKLHWSSKDKLKKVLSWFVVSCMAVLAVLSFYTRRTEKTPVE